MGKFISAVVIIVSVCAVVISIYQLLPFFWATTHAVDYSYGAPPGNSEPNTPSAATGSLTLQYIINKNPKVTKIETTAADDISEIPSTIGTLHELKALYIDH